MQSHPTSSNWSIDGSRCVRVFLPFARLLPGRHVYGLCTALTKFHGESHSSSSSLLSPFSTSPSLEEASHFPWTSYVVHT